jgi:hypothetical protein
MEIPTCTVAVTCALFACGVLPAVAEDVTIIYKVTYGESATPIRYKYISPGRPMCPSRTTEPRG